MITLVPVPAKHSQLPFMRPFGFRARLQTKTRKRFYGNPRQHEAQNIIVSRIELLINRFQQLPCDVAIRVGASQGDGVSEGEVKAYEGRSFGESSAILKEISAAVNDFTSQYDGSEFVVQASQTITITQVHSLPV